MAAIAEAAATGRVSAGGLGSNADSSAQLPAHTAATPAQQNWGWQRSPSCASSACARRGTCPSCGRQTFRRAWRISS